MMTNLADSADPHPIAKEIGNGFPSYIDHNQKMHILFTPNDGGSQLNPWPATSVGGVELSVDYDYDYAE
ncbi:MAG: hypothetical protein H6729_09970 [Deltaproteobacteria bacterium]|nr:hypothetical protein [Deltaproteobacteria bacterium]